MQAETLQQHKWLQQLVGEWTAEFDCIMEPGQEPQKMRGKESVRMLGELWLVATSQGEDPTGAPHENIMTIGYDPAQGKFVGTFASSCMSMLWIYQGSLLEGGNVLTLDTIGPSFTKEGLVNYQDIITIIDKDHRMMTSQCQMEDGSWNQFMTAHYHRVK